MTISNASDMFLMSILKGNVTIPFASKCWITEKIFENLIQISQSHDLPHAYIVSDDGQVSLMSLLTSCAMRFVLQGSSCIYHE